MTTFLRWYASRVSGRSAHEWVYAGGHAALVREVEDYVRRPDRFGQVPLSVDSCSGRGLSWPELSARLQSASLQRTQHLLIIRDGHVVPEDVWLELLSWRRRSDVQAVRSRHLLVTSPERFNEKDRSDPRWLAFVGSSFGRYVDCHISLERQPKYAELKLGAARARVDLTTLSEELTALCGGDLSRLRSECDKLVSYCGDEPIRPEDVQAVVSPSPGELFVADLVYGRKAQAVARAPYVGSIRFVLGSLDYHLHTIYLIHRAKTEGKRVSASRASARVGVPVFVVKRFERIAVTYDLSTVQRRYHALVSASLRASQRDRPEWTLVPLVLAW